MYWKPVWAVLEDEFELLLVNARHVKQVPGRKTDVSDAAWLCQLLEAGLLRASFVPPKPIRALRQPDPVSQDADPGAPAGGQPAAQGARGHRDQARLRRHRHPRRLRPGDARRAVSRARPTPRCSPSSRRAGCARRSRRCERRSRAASSRMHALLIGAILAHLDFLDEQIDAALRRDRGAARALSRRRLSCCARSPAIADRAPPRHHRRDRHRHEPLPDRRAPRLLGRPVPRQRPVRRQTPLRQDPQGLQVARHRARRSRAGRHPHQRQLPRSPIPATPAPRGHKKSARRRQTLDPLRLLAHAHHRRALPRPRRRLLPHTATPNAQTKRLVAQLERLGHTVTLETLPEAA